MAVVADRVIVELEAKLDRYDANVRRAEQSFNAATRKISADAKRMEAQITASSTAIGNRMRGLAGAFAGVFTARAVQELADGYTRFTNQLKVAGLEGERLGGVQDKLFASAQRYGVQLESLGTLYSRGSQAAGELGASQADLLQFTNGVAASLKIQGSSAASAQGALLQLGQALASGTVRAEEFNSINEGALPILQAVARNLDGAGGSVGRLKLLVNDGKVSSEAFFRAFLAGSAQLEEQAAKSTLTIGNSFTVLNNALGKFIGETDESLSATERISAAIIALSENLDTVTQALGLLSAVLLGRYVAGLVAAGTATGVVSAAIFAMQARAIGAATTMEALAFASRAAGASMLAAFGGPVGLAVLALAAGVYYLATAVDQTGKANEDYVKQLDFARAATEKVADATDRLANSQGAAREAALANAKALREETIQALANARAKAAAARAGLQTTISENRQLLGSASRTVRGAGGGIDPIATQIRVNDARERSARANIMAAEQSVAEFNKQIFSLDEAISAAPIARPPAAAAPARRTRTRSAPEGRQGPDPDEIARRFADDLARGELEYRSAMADVTGTLEARAALDRERIRVDQEINARAIAADEDLTDAQRQQLLALNDRIAAARQEAVNAAAREQQQADALELQVRDVENQRNLLEAAQRLADTTAERKSLALQILALEYQEQRARLHAIAENARLDEAQREAARRRLAVLDQLEQADRDNVDRQYEGAGKKYLRELNAADINEQIEQVKVRGLQSLEDKLVDVTAKIFKMGGAFGEVANQIISDLLRIAIQQAIIKPLATALFGGDGSSGGGGLGGIFGGIINGVLGRSPSTPPIAGRASGGNVLGGQMYRVNETGVEGFRPAGSGSIIPLGRMRAPSAGVRLYQTVNVDARGVNPDGFAEHIKSAVRRETVAIVGAGMQRVSQGVPARLAQYQRDGV